ncbi:hypothetical protein FJ934_19850 [Mesorhizobium sp. B2-4-12]|uniref:hypothetical protein n=1 Tax=Mesorhizobium sp. B2-4-12 TaxID=2589937 RepID=UPI00112A7DF8|nr:hypothetical protein [Mesorhizobium sp. B2-4-12]TPK92895.1 hypothetical protein FJ934_19850 [Mesorhizobium sp. B2-4-12]
MKKELASFRDFLRTGRLGPISPTLKMNEVAELLGIPAHADSDYWTFGKLEISFDEEAPHKMKWLQIEEAGYLAGDFEVFTDRLVLLLDNFNGYTKPSDFLRAGLWAPENATLFYTASLRDIELNICAGAIQIHFRVDADFIEDRDAEKYLDSVTMSKLVGDIDHRTKIDSIYSYSHPALEQISGAIDWRPIDGRNYLDLVGNR